MRALGCRAHDFGRLGAEELGSRVSAAGFTCVQLAPAKAIEGIKHRPGALDPARAAAISASLAARGVRIAVLGCYINPIHPDPEERESSIRRFAESLALARVFGCGIVATETGSLNADCSFHPGNSGKAAFSELVGSLETIAVEAERHGVYACIEGVASHVASSPARLAAILEAVPSPWLRVLFDPVNLLTASTWGEQGRMFEEAESLLGGRILAFHAKDFQIEGVVSRVCPPCRGLLDYGRFLDMAERVAPDADVLIEDLRPADMAGAREFLLSRLGGRG
ncbi:MAG TPA: sugar phosphate isomerase/epimerase family protein [Rectinemataceae bacterium]|nr:sugar phosphate isomerase/epimerase family protein [Rectinemataceae bacterium]